MQLGQQYRSYPTSVDYTVKAFDDMILVDASVGNRVITLPDPSLVTGKEIRVIKTDASTNAVTVVGTINGSANYVLYYQNECVSFNAVGSGFIAAGVGLRTVQQAPESKKNLIINGNMDFWQRTTSTTSGTYFADRWIREANVSTLRGERSTSVPNQESLYSMRMACEATGSHTGLQVTRVEQRIEGNLLREIAGKRATFSFYVKSNKTGTYCVAFQNSAANRSYVAEYQISVANTWEKKIIPFIHNTTGSWNYDHTHGMSVFFMLGAGSSHYTTPGVWQSGNVTATANQVNFQDSATNEIFFSQGMLNEGSAASSFKLAGDTYAGELALCQRYCVEFNPGGVVLAPFSTGIWLNTTAGRIMTPFPVTMRSDDPTLICSGSFYTWITGSSAVSANPTINRVNRLCGWADLTSSGGTAGGLFHLMDGGSGTARMRYDAEL